MSAMARPVMPARLGRGKTVRFGENGSRIVWNRLESSGIARNSLLMAVCRASCALNATLLSRLLRNRHCQSLLIVRLVVAGGDVYRRRPQQVGAPKMRRSTI
ncbi:hypothetical protein EAI75_09960 [Bifidobacterium longum]|uniref:Uncharacterized protein n=1 Tax=Bifidobacterium longum TaxID=216816 RepID=A0A2U0BR52_BIFLN|nr:hypothetical protein GBL36_00420 [Bifidobacterium longum]MDN4190736.1 hypothetical protein [Bifidobacterium longum subsp. longum]KAB6724172.1 hypothetical protein GBL29_02225 [Bifidobacterium longum]KAB6725233.1 hypothetical protein GBL27_00410 [Bifidobacterium longum]KAB6728554.1 hypothetical protein GBL26_02350 [Bifidobacterium longum]